MAEAVKAIWICPDAFNVVPPDFTLLSSTLREAPAFAELASREGVRVVSTLTELLDSKDDVLVVGAAFDRNPLLGVLPLVHHHPVIALCEDHAIADVLEAGAVDVLPPDASVDAIVRSVKLARHRHNKVWQLSAQADDLRSAIGALPVGVVALERGVIVYENDALQSMMGGRSKLGEPVQHLIHEEDLIIWDANRRPAELRLRPPDAKGQSETASPTIVQVSELSSLQTREGTLALVTFQDVTAERALLAELHGAERNASMQNIALEIAHEVNNPLAIFAQDLPELSDILTKEKDLSEGDVVREILEELTVATDRIGSAIKKLRNAATTTVPSCTVEEVLSAARASATMKGADQFTFTPLPVAVEHATLDLAPATATPLLRSLLSFAGRHAQSVVVGGEFRATTCEITLDLSGPTAGRLLPELAGAASPVQLAAMPCPDAQALSVELSIAQRAGVVLLCTPFGDDAAGVRLSVRLPRDPASTFMPDGGRDDALWQSIARKQAADPSSTAVRADSRSSFDSLQ